MIVGLTYDLRSWYLDRGYSMEETAEFDKEETIAGLEDALHSLGYTTARIGNIFQLVETLHKGSTWDIVFNITEGLYGDGRESAVPALLDQYRIPYVFSGPVVMGIALNKQMARVVVSAAGVPVAPGMLIKNISELHDCHLQFPLFVKPVSEGTGKGITEKSLVDNDEDLRIQVDHIIKQFKQPALVEEYLPGREFTIGVTGSGKSAKAIGGMEVMCDDNQPYSVFVKENYVGIVKYAPIPKNLEDECYSVAVNAWKALGALDGGRVDVKADKHGNICFIEANPLAGLNHIHSDLPILSRMYGIEFGPLIEIIMNEALSRYNLSR